MIDDPEILELLRDDPELLAIADAIQQTQQPAPGRRRPTWRARAGLGLAACLAIVAAAGAFVLRPSAEAGLPDGTYVHVVLQRDDPDSWLLSLADGSRRPSVYRDDVWIRDDNGVAFAEHSWNGELLETSTDRTSAASSSLGPTRLSPDLRTNEGVAPLVGVYHGAFAALQHGGRIVDGPSTIYGRHVRWIGFGRVGSLPRKIALDADTGTPVAVIDATDGTPTRIVRYGEGDPPRTLPKPPGEVVGEGRSTRGVEVSPGRAVEVLPGALWAGRTVAGLQLKRLLLQHLTQDRIAGWRPGLEVRYGQAADHPSLFAPYLFISQARRPELGYEYPGIGRAGQLPPPGTLLLRGAGPETGTGPRRAFVHIHGMYLRIATNLPSSELPAIVRSLRPLT